MNVQAQLQKEEMDWLSLFTDLAFLLSNLPGMVLGSGDTTKKKTKISAIMEMVF